MVQPSSEVWRYVRSVVWKLACKYDDVDPKSMFVVFSSKNPYDLSFGKITQIANIHVRIMESYVA